MNGKISRPLYCDTNSFGYLSDKNRYDSFIEKLEKSENKAALELVAPLKSEDLIKHPVAFIELFGFKQKFIHQRLEKIIPSLEEGVKKAMKASVKEFKCKVKNSEKLHKLCKGFDKGYEVLYNGIYNHLHCNEPDLQLLSFEMQIEFQNKQIKDPSSLFLHQYNYIKENLNENFIKDIIEDLSVEAIYRYGRTLIAKLYPGDKELTHRWVEYLSALCFMFWEKGINTSAYRIMAIELERLKRKYSSDFHPAKLLRPHDDTIDSFIIHALGFGWFCSSEKLTPIIVLSQDPFDKTFSSVKQYQEFLAYAQNPLDNNVGATPRIKHEVLPGAFYSFDKVKESIKIVTFNPSRILKRDPGLQIESSHIEIEEVFL